MGSPIFQTPLSLSQNATNTTSHKESTLVPELKKVIEKQGEQIRELMKKLEKALSNGSKVRPNSNELKESAENTIENPRQLPRRRLLSAGPAMATPNSEAQAMEADEPLQQQS